MPKNAYVNTLKIKKIAGYGGVPCLLVDERYQIYLDSGIIYDTKKAEDIPQYIFDIRDRAMEKRNKDV